MLGLAPAVAVMMIGMVGSPSSEPLEEEDEGLVFRRRELQLLRNVSLTHPMWASLSKQENIWKGLSLERWPNISSFIGVSDWLAFYQRRHKMLRKKVDRFEPDPPSIENCFTTNSAGDSVWDFRCPVAASFLKRTDNKTVDFCTVRARTRHCSNQRP